MAAVYKVVTVPVAKGEGFLKQRHIAWASSDAAAKKARRELADKHGLGPLKDVAIETIDVPTSKAGIIEWLNKNFNVAGA